MVKKQENEYSHTQDERNQEAARNIVLDWQSFKGKDWHVKRLAQEAGSDQSYLGRMLKGEVPFTVGVARKLDRVFEAHNMDFITRRKFLTLMGLGALARVIPPGLLSTSSEPSIKNLMVNEGMGGTTPINPSGLNLRSVDRRTLGTHLKDTANSIAQYSWERAIPYYRDAEIAFGKGCSEAAHCSCMVAQMLVNLCDYDAARQELSWTRQIYNKEMDPSTRAEWYRIMGWIHYYEGNYGPAIYNFNKGIGQANEVGNLYLAEGSQHFTGRSYADWGQVAPADQQLDLWLKAEKALLASEKIHKEHGTDVQLGYDYLRQAQLLRVQATEGKSWKASKNRFDEARSLREKARSEFGQDLASLHADIEDAEIGLMEGDIQMTVRKAKGVLERYNGLKYAKGMSDSLWVVGSTEMMQLNLKEALEQYVAALCIYPYKDHLRNRELWNSIGNIHKDLRNEKGKNSYASVVRKMNRAAEEKQREPFSHLNNVAADRSGDIAFIFKRLNSLNNT